MALARWRKRDEWEPFRDLFDLQKEINRLFDISFSRLPQPFTGEETFSPAIELYEKDNEYIVEAELPGLKHDEIKVNVEGDVLTISGERKREKEIQRENVYRSERFYGRFVRRIALPEDVDLEKVKASYKDGILKISVPKSEKAKPKKIDVKIE